MFWYPLIGKFMFELLNKTVLLHNIPRISIWPCQPTIAGTAEAISKSFTVFAVLTLQNYVLIFGDTSVLDKLPPR